MLYLVYGTQLASIKKRVNKLSKELLGELDDFNFEKYDARHTLIQDIVSSADSFAFGSPEKVIVVENAYFFDSKVVSDKSFNSNQDFDSLKKYLANPNDSTHLIFSIGADKLSEKNEYLSLFKKAKGNLIEIESASEEDLMRYGKKYFNQKLETKIDDDALKELLERCHNDLIAFQNNAIKLSLYTSHVYYEDVCLMVSRNLEDAAYLLFDYLISKKINQALALYSDLKANQIEPSTLIGMLGKQFRLLSMLYYLVNVKGIKDNDEIGKILSIKPARSGVLRRKLGLVSDDKISKTLLDLYELDKKIKSGDLDKDTGFTLFLITY